MEWKMIKEKKFFGCPGSIYIDLIHEISGIILSEEVLWNLCNDLKKKLSDRNWYELILSYNEYEYGFGTKYTPNKRTWLKLYYSRVSETIQCDEIESIRREEIKRVIIEKWSYTCGNIYARIIDEICSYNRNPKILRDFSNELYKIWEEENKKDFYINANLGNIEITDSPKDIDDPFYDKENHYYHFYVDENDNANFIELKGI